MSTTVSDLRRTDRVTCIRCEDVVPGTRGWELDGIWHCLPCAEVVMRLELVALRGELS